MHGKTIQLNSKRLCWVIFLKTLVVLLFTATVQTGYSQDLRFITDTLPETASPEEKMKNWLTLAYNLHKQDAEQAEIYIQKALTLAKEVNNTDVQGLAYGQLGWIYVYRNDREQAEQIFEKAFDFLIQSEDTSKHGTAYEYLGSIARLKNDPEKAMEHMLQALDIFTQVDSKYGMASSHRFVAGLLLNAGNHKAAVRHLIASRDLYKELGHPDEVINSNNDLAYNYSRMGDYEKAKVIYDSNLVQGRAIGDTNNIRITLLNLGVLYYDLEDFQKAIEYLKESLVLWNQFGRHEVMAQVQYNLGASYLALKNYEEALSHLQQADMLADSTNSFLDLRANIYENLSEVHYALGNLKDAYAYAKQFRVAGEQLLFDKTDGEIATMEAEFEAKLQEREVKQLEEQAARATERRNVIIVILAQLLLIILLLFFRLRLKRKKDQEIAAIQARTAALEKDRLEDEIAFDQKKLASFSLQLIQRNDLVHGLSERLGELIGNNGNGDLVPELIKLKKDLYLMRSQQKDWEEFELYFEQVHHGFFEKLKKDFTSLTTKDLRLAALLKLQMTSKEISRIMDIAPSSVEMSRYRLRKKLEVPKSQRLSDFITTF